MTLIDNIQIHLKNFQQILPDQVAKIYLVINQTAQTKPLIAFFEHEVGEVLPFWNGTPYQAWKEVVPFFAQISPQHTFLQWLFEQEDDNFGFAVISHLEFKPVYQHLQSLSQIYLQENTTNTAYPTHLGNTYEKKYISDNKSVFFKFWEPIHSFPVLRTVEKQEYESLMGPCFALISRTESLQNTAKPILNWQPFPWFELSFSAQQKIFTKMPNIFITNTLTRLEEDYPEIFNAIPRLILNQKIHHFHSLHTLTNNIDMQALISFLRPNITHHL